QLVPARHGRRTDAGQAGAVVPDLGDPLVVDRHGRPDHEGSVGIHAGVHGARRYRSVTACFAAELGRFRAADRALKTRWSIRPAVTAADAISSPASSRFVAKAGGFYPVENDLLVRGGAAAIGRLVPNMQHLGRPRAGATRNALVLQTEHEIGVFAA